MMNEIEKVKPEFLKQAFRRYPEELSFASFQKIKLEIGPGKGEFILWAASQNLDTLWIAVELRRGRYEKIKEQLIERKINNVLLIHGDARHCLKSYLKENSLDEAFILFPDPWPKRRHNKHRMVSVERVEEIRYFLKKEGRLWLATDHADYALWMKELFSNETWKALPGQSLYPTYFETKWKKMGLEIYYFCFEKK